MGATTDWGLFCREEAIISVFENNTNAVVNIFDVTLQVRGSNACTRAAQYCSHLAITDRVRSLRYCSR